MGTLNCDKCGDVKSAIDTKTIFIDPETTHVVVLLERCTREDVKQELQVMFMKAVIVKFAFSDLARVEYYFNFYQS